MVENLGSQVKFRVKIVSKVNNEMSISNYNSVDGVSFSLAVAFA
jgi:hypothetical protein